MTPTSGNTVSGTNAVTEIETASVIHHTTIHVATAITFWASGETISIGQKSNARNSVGPSTNPIFLEEL